MFNNAQITIPENLHFPFETPKRNLATILREYPGFKKSQKVILGKKQGISAKCRACRKKFNIGCIVLRIENCVVVPYGSIKAVVNTIFSYVKPACTNSMSKWNNLRKVTEDNIATEAKIGDKEKEEVMRQFRFWEHYYLVLLYFAQSPTEKTIVWHLKKTKYIL